MKGVPSPERHLTSELSGTHPLLGPEATHSHAPLSRYEHLVATSFLAVNSVLHISN